MPEFTCYAWKRFHYKLLDLTGMISFLCTATGLALCLGFGADNESRMLAVYCFIAAFPLAIAAVFFYFYLRFKIEIYGEENELKVKILRFSLSQAVLESPFELDPALEQGNEGKISGKKDIPDNFCQWLAATDFFRMEKQFIQASANIYVYGGEKKKAEKSIAACAFGFVHQESRSNCSSAWKICFLSLN